MENNSSYRPILFRGRCIHTGVWVYGHLFQGESGSYIFIKNGDKFPEMKCIEPSSLGQFTGFFDKGGEKVFEGDIIKFRPHTTYTYVVKWDVDGFVLVHQDLKNWDGNNMRWGRLSRVEELGEEIEILGQTN